MWPLRETFRGGDGGEGEGETLALVQAYRNLEDLLVHFLIQPPLVRLAKISAPLDSLEKACWTPQPAFLRRIGGVKPIYFRKVQYFLSGRWLAS